MEIHITSDSVVIRTGQETVAVNLNSKAEFLVTANSDMGGPTRTIRRKVK